MTPDELRELRSRCEDAEAELDRRLTHRDSPGARYVGKVYKGPAYSADFPRYYLTHPARLAGAEAEGLARAPDTDTATTVVVAVFDRAPTAGDILVASLTPDGRWVADRSGAASAGPYDLYTLQSCNCPTPGTLRMTSADPACNYRMFQSCTLQYGPPPAIYASLNITGPTWLSTEMFLDPIADSSFQYHLFCLNNVFYLMRLYPTSPYGSPFRDGTLYTWLVGGFGNCCGDTMTAPNPAWQAWYDCCVANGQPNPGGFGTTPPAVCGPQPPLYIQIPCPNSFYLHKGAPFPGSDAS